MNGRARRPRAGAVQRCGRGAGQQKRRHAVRGPASLEIRRRRSRRVRRRPGPRTRIGCDGIALWCRQLVSRGSGDLGTRRLARAWPHCGAAVHDRRRRSRPQVRDAGRALRIVCRRWTRDGNHTRRHAQKHGERRGDCNAGRSSSAGNTVGFRDRVRSEPHLARSQVLSATSTAECAHPCAACRSCPRHR